jgi:uncharacterized SAM-binding protein YcdF (DUF218 family)
MRRILLTFLLIPAFFLSVEAALFLTILLDDDGLAKADLIAVFAGSPDRIEAGYRLVSSSYGENLAISPATEGMLDHYERRYRPAATFTRIMERQARTTFENALLTGELATTNGFKSVIVVTSWYHLPRSFILLRLLSLGSELDTQGFGVATGKISLANWYRHGVGWKMVYNEMVECWGSFLELVQFKWSGRLPEKESQPSATLALLKRIFLFEINERSLR